MTTPQRNRKAKWLAPGALAGTLVVALSGMLVGCGGETAVSVAPQAASLSQTSADKTTTSKTSPNSNAKTDTETDAHSLPADTESHRQFKPPFPERVELFHPPGGTNPAKPAARPSGERNIDLKGFARSDKLRAVLVIDGELASLAAGDSSEGVEVIAIDPPKVTLQRGRVRWVESLERPAQ